MPNHLANETSPYLRQHADNPVDWWPWSDAALAEARAANKPILLSIGYSACHWCHVMAHESFEDEATARAMNALFVNIKVDREERPDIDKVYQLAHQALARRGGGWPLTVFLTPDDLLPFYAGTYFPKSPRPGLPAFVQVLEGVRSWYDQKPDEVRAQNDALARFLADHGRDDAFSDALTDAPIHVALERIAASFDANNGGHRGAPKFPHAGEIELLLTRFPGQGNEPHMARLTFACIAERGLSDHLGGGFFRYCVDERWEIPHFEKMLYDNAQLLPLYARAGVELDAPEFANAARACATWITGEMQAPEGGLWSSLDADSEGEEGRYYVWQRDEIRRLLDADTYTLLERRFGLDRPANFENHAWHLRAAMTWDAVAASLQLPLEATLDCWDVAREILLATRSRRVRPGLDDKVLTAWNALTIAGAARTLRVQPDLRKLSDCIERALDRLYANVWNDGRLYAVLAEGQARFPAYLDDYAFLLDALLGTLQLRWKRRDLDWAIALADALLERFEDRDRGGFFFTAHDAQALPQRPKPWMDESLPSGNAIAARALLKLGHLLGEPRYLDAAERCLRAAWAILAEAPQACSSLLLALGDFLYPPAHLVVRCRNADLPASWQQQLAHPDHAGIDAYVIPLTEPALPGVLSDQHSEAEVTAYLCRGTSCAPPINTLDGFRAALHDTE